MKMKTDCQKIKSNLVQQDCYLRHFVPLTQLKKRAPIKTYVDVVEVDELVDGVPTHREIYKEVPYPHTPETLNSYRSSCDYKTDPANAVRPARENLGDVTEAQKILGALSSAKSQEVLQGFIRKLNDMVKASHDELHPAPEEVKDE